MRARFRALPKWARVTLWTILGLFVALLFIGAIAPANKTATRKPAAVTTPTPPVVHHHRKRHHRPAPAAVATTPTPTLAQTATQAPAPSTTTQAQPPPSPTEDVGSSSHAGDAQFCSSHQCIGDFTGEGGTIVRCSDGAYSHAGGISGSCSHHGGEG